MNWFVDRASLSPVLARDIAYRTILQEFDTKAICQFKRMNGSAY